MINRFLLPLFFVFGDTRETREKRKEEFDHSSEFQGVISRESWKRVKERNYIFNNFQVLVTFLTYIIKIICRLT